MLETGGRWRHVSEHIGGRTVCSGPGHGGAAGAARACGEITPSYVSWRGGRSHHQGGPDNFSYLLGSPDSFRKSLLVQEQKPKPGGLRSHVC